MGLLKKEKEKRFHNKIADKISSVLKQNMAAINKGNRHLYQLNCNFLKGMDYVVELLEK